MNWVGAFVDRAIHYREKMRRLDWGLSTLPRAVRLFVCPLCPTGSLAARRDRADSWALDHEPAGHADRAGWRRQNEAGDRSRAGRSRRLRRWSCLRLAGAGPRSGTGYLRRIARAGWNADVRSRRLKSLWPNSGRSNNSWHWTTWSRLLNAVRDIATSSHVMSEYQGIGYEQNGASPSGRASIRGSPLESSGHGRFIGRSRRCWRHSAAVELFVERAQSVDSNFALNNRNSAEIAEFAGDWTDCRWPLSWRLPASECCHPRRCCPGSSGGCHYSLGARETRRHGNRRYEIRWPGVTTCSPKANR